MKRQIYTFVLALILIIALLVYSSCSPGDVDADLAIVNVTVIPMDSERVLESQTVLIRDGHIYRIRPTGRINVSEEVPVVDGSGRYLIPGLAEMHAHVPSPPSEFPDEQSRQEFSRWVEDVLFLYVAAGVTTARSMIGHPNHLILRERIESGELIGPRLWTSGPGLHGGNLQTVERAREIPFEQKEAGYDFMKLLWGIERDVYEALYEAAQETDFWYAGHVPAAVGVERALETGYLSIDHLDGYVEMIIAGDATDLPEGHLFGFGLTEYIDESKIPEAARMTRDAGVWVVPTQMLFDGMWGVETPEELAARPELRYIPDEMLQNWRESTTNYRREIGHTYERAERYREIRLRLIKALHDEGAGIILGSDAPQWWNVPGFAIHRELNTYVEAGLTPFEALRTGTVNVARFLEVGDHAGTVEEGNYADLILLADNPLDDIGNVEHIEGVFIRGEWLSQEVLQERLERIAGRND
jgi:imidazolonepropionase-like amidohydrolase